jgi:hypothetical protein
MGNTASTPPIDDKKLSQSGYIIGIILVVVVIIAIIIAIFKFSPPLEDIKHSVSGVFGSLKGAAKGVSSTSTGRVSQLPWGTIVPVFLGVVCVFYFSIAFWYKYIKGRYRANPESYNELVNIQQATISNALGTIYPSAVGTASNGNSVCTVLTTSPVPAPFSSIITPTNSGIGDARALINWRPLTVRLPGYLNSPSGPANGVFSPSFGIDAALTLGARGFFFDIDYEDAAPCLPVVIFRDNSGIKRSLNYGDIQEAMMKLASKAFTNNYDPVLIIIYLRRVPGGKQQMSNFFSAIAKALIPLSPYHLGQTDKGNFHSCRSENILFTSPITDYQKKFIIITNYDTSKLPSRSNPKNNLHYWTNARIYLDESGKVTTGLGSVTESAPASPAAVARVGHIDQLLNIDSSPSSQVLSKYQTQTSGAFSIAIGSPDYPYTPAQVNKLMNILGIQCVPLDVIGLGISSNHVETIRLGNATRPFPPITSPWTSLSPMYNLNPSTSTDILSFWAYTGWSMKNVSSGTQGFQDYKEGFEEAAPVPPSTPIPGFIIPKPVPPRQPSPSMNSNGGLVTIS